MTSANPDSNNTTSFSTSGEVKRGSKNAMRLNGINKPLVLHYLNIDFKTGETRITSKPSPTRDDNDDLNEWPTEELVAMESESQGLLESCHLKRIQPLTPSGDKDSTDRQYNNRLEDLRDASYGFTYNPLRKFSHAIIDCTSDFQRKYSPGCFNYLPTDESGRVKRPTRGKYSEEFINNFEALTNLGLKEPSFHGVQAEVNDQVDTVSETGDSNI